MRCYAIKGIPWLCLHLPLFFLFIASKISVIGIAMYDVHYPFYVLGFPPIGCRRRFDKVTPLFCDLIQNSVERV